MTTERINQIANGLRDDDDRRFLCDVANELAEAEQTVEALEAKVKSLAPHGTCACSFDRPGDVCMIHSPQLTVALAEIRRLTDRLNPDAVPESDECGCDNCRRVT